MSGVGEARPAVELEQLLKRGETCRLVKSDHEYLTGQLTVTR